MSFILLLVPPYLFSVEMGDFNMPLHHGIQVEQIQKCKLWGKNTTTSAHASLSKSRSCTFNIYCTLKATILLLPPIPIYVIIRHGRINTAEFKLTLSLNCGPVINNSDFESLFVDFRFCCWYSWFKEKQTKHPFHNLLYCCKQYLCFHCQCIFLFPVFSVGVPLRLWIHDKEGMRLYDIPAHSFKLKLLEHVHSSSFWLPFPLVKFHRWLVPPEVFKTGSQ